MSNEQVLLKGIVVSQKKTIEALQHESKQLRAALRVFTEQPVGQSSEDVGETDLEEEKEELAPIWDDGEDIYRCVLCGLEIIEREFQHEYGEEVLDFFCEESPDGTPLDESDRTFHLCDESYLLPSMRCTTPLLDIDHAHLHPETVAYGFEDRLEEYQALLTRGATRLMCETFNLSYSDETGIVLEMKDPDLEDLFDEWAGHAIVSSKCKSWKIFFGRELHLAADDVDGSDYVDNFLEEALLFDRDSSIQWKTTEVRARAWETKADLSEGRDDYENDQDDDRACAQVGDNNDGDGDGDGEEGVYDTDEADYYTDEEDEEEKALRSMKRVARDEYESDEIDDECVADDSGAEYGFESDRDKDLFWDSDNRAGEGDVTEEYETDPPSPSEDESGEEDKEVNDVN